MLPLCDVFMIDADSAMDTPTMSKVALSLVFVCLLNPFKSLSENLSHLAFWLYW